MWTFLALISSISTFCCKHFLCKIKEKKYSFKITSELWNQRISKFLVSNLNIDLFNIIIINIFRYHIVYIVLVLHGIGALMAWNMLINANSVSYNILFNNFELIIVEMKLEFSLKIQNIFWIIFIYSIS
jgi:hypothetical protein